MADLHMEVWGTDEPAVLVHGSSSWGEATFAAQRELSDAYRLLIVDRRGFGDSPPTSRVDFEADAEDIAELIGAGAHLLGLSYGGIVCLLAAARNPGAVRSLAVIEPPAFGVARDNPIVERFVTRLRHVYPHDPQRATQVSPEQFAQQFRLAWGFEDIPIPNFNQKQRAAVRSTMTERAPWDAEIPFARLADEPFPKLIISGGWENAPARAREIAGRAFNITCDVIAEGINGERLVFPEAEHAANGLGKPFNDWIRQFWASTCR